MDAQELYVDKNGDFTPAAIYFCSKCRIVHRSKDLADQCCQPRICTYCGEELPKRWGMTIHSHCHDKKMFEKAEKLTEWEGMICVGDDFYDSIEEFLENLQDNGQMHELPEYVHPCEPIKFPGIDIDSVIENCLCDNIAEDTEPEPEDVLVDLDNLREYIKFWNEKQSTISYSANIHKVVLLDRKKIWAHFLTNEDDKTEEFNQQKAQIEAILTQTRED